MGYTFCPRMIFIPDAPLGNVSRERMMAGQSILIPGIPCNLDSSANRKQQAITQMT